MEHARFDDMVFKYLRRENGSVICSFHGPSRMNIGWFLQVPDELYRESAGTSDYVRGSVLREHYRQAD